MKVYLSGKITGDSNYKQKFNAMAEELLSYGYVVFNPAILPDGFEYEEAKRLGLQILDEDDLKIRRALLQICKDSKRIAEIEINSDENKAWAEKIEQLSERIECKIKSFDPSFDEETNLLQIYEMFESDLKQFFIEEFIYDSDKQIEYDIMEKMNGIDFEEKIKLTQMYKTTADLVELFREKLVKVA